MQSHYEINVSRRGQHFFATAERSAVDRDKAADLFVELSRRFPASEGFEIMVTKWEVHGKIISTWGEFL